MVVRALIIALLWVMASAPVHADLEDDRGPAFSRFEPAPADLSRADPPPADRTLPPPVDLGIPNIRQQTKVWCWAAVAQQIIHKKRGKSPPQCALVAMAQGRYPGFCCPGHARCAVQGTMAQIRGLIRNFGRRVTEVHPPSGPMVLYRALRAGRPIILALRNGPGTGHVVVLTGMTWVRTTWGRRAILHINDPIGAFPARMRFREIMPRWHAAVVVY
ncbi:MAG: papain-like cysteine protease family protein [Bauldia litoralis]